MGAAGNTCYRSTINTSEHSPGTRACLGLQAKRKNMPLAARTAAVRKRMGGGRKGGKGGGKQFRGRAKGVR